MYSTYERRSRARPPTSAAFATANKIAILGGGPNRIGQGIEFDYCCCHACFALPTRASRRS
jgi:carbamoyl-phosphate synthase large subunit